MTNPNLNEVTGKNEELYRHAFLNMSSLSNGDIEIMLECYDREVTVEEARKLVQMIISNKEMILNRYHARSLSIIDYMFGGTFDYC